MADLVLIDKPVRGVAVGRHAYDLGRDGTGADSLGAEAGWKGDSFLMEDPGQFAARRAAVFSRGRGQ